MAVRIRCPSSTIDNDITDPGNYFCRKGFYALNIQGMCDARKRVTWVSTGHKGSTHDSVAFSETQLSDLLAKKQKYLYEHRLFIVGDSAYPMFSYLVIPYRNAKSNSMEDAFNYWQSNSRIHIECTFGEIVMRWGILWRTLKFSIESTGSIVNACCHLHNFLIDQRNNDDDSDLINNLDSATEEMQSQFTDELVIPLVSDNNALDVGGRPQTNDDFELAIEFRLELALRLSSNYMTRPLQKGMKYNHLGNIYMSDD